MTTATPEAIKKLAPPPPIPVDAGSPVVNIPVSRIVPSPWNRKEEVTDELVESVRKNGVVQNVVVRPHIATEEDVALYSMKSDPFVVGEKISQLVAGERRWGAAKRAGRTHVPAAIRHLSDIEAMDFQIDENENRKNLKPMQRAEAYDRLRMLYQQAHAKEKDYTEAKAIEAVAASRGCSSRTVYDVISLKKLTPNAQNALRNGEMENSHGVVLAGRSPEEQDKLLLWLRQQTHHSQGDVPSVRRLKLEIRQLDLAAEQKKSQEKLFKEEKKEDVNPDLCAKVEFDGKTIDLLPGPLPGSVKTALQRIYPLLESADFLEDGKVKVATDRTTKPFYMSVSQLQTLLPRTVTPTADKKKPPTKAELEAAEKQRDKDAKAAEKRRQQEAKAERDNIRNARIDKKANGLLFSAFARKAQINSRFLTHAIPDLVFSSIDNNNYEEFQIDPDFGQRSLGWPAPENGNEYSVEEICNLTKKHTRKFTPGLLAAVILSIHVRPAVTEKLAKYFGIDHKKLRKQAAAEVKEEDRKARLPKEPETKKEKQLHAIVKGDVPVWEKLRRTGASDAELRKVLCQQLPNDGGHGSKELGDVYARSGNDKPRVWFNSMYPGKKPPSLQGLELVAAVRDLLKIPEKGEVDA